MTDKEPEIQWWIARDGEQHGPLTDAEMRAFIDMRHLRPTDLVWRPGFVDWRAAPLIFPMHAYEAPPANLQAMVAAPAGDEPTSLARQTAEATAQANAEEKRGSEKGAGWSGRVREVLARFRPAPSKRADVADRRFRRRPERFGGMRAAKTVAIAASVCVLLAGAGLLVLNRAAVLRIAGLDRPAISATAASPAASTGSPEALDARLQRIPLWTAAKKEFPEWYGDLLRKAAKLPDGSDAGTALSRHLAESVVALRRENASAALAASPARLRDIAEAFVENLRTLKAKGTDACYAFISQGEISPATFALLGEADEGVALQNQVAAIIAAIAEGRASPVAHGKPSKADYDTLASGLMKLGWSEEDLKLFANPRALARSTPGKVCQMVHDWFTAHIAIEDASTQERLLVETLRPVVAG